MCVLNSKSVWCNCTYRNRAGICPHHLYLRTSAAAVEQEPVVQGWYTRVATEPQGCTIWDPLADSVFWNHCATYLANYTVAGVLTTGHELECQETMDATTDENPEGYMVRTHEELLCSLCTTNHGRTKSSSKQSKSKKKGSSKSSLFVQGPMPHTSKPAR